VPSWENRQILYVCEGCGFGDTDARENAARVFAFGGELRSTGDGDANQQADSGAPDPFRHRTLRRR
jgi:hypothetical protein